MDGNFVKELIMKSYIKDPNITLTLGFSGSGRAEIKEFKD